MNHNMMLLANESMPWMQGGQWAVLAAIAALGAVVAAIGFRRWKLPPETRRCPNCGYDLRATPSTRCGECGYLASAESELHRGKRNRPLFALGLIIAITYPCYRAVLWSRDRGWTPPLSARVVVQSINLPNDAVAERLKDRNPWEFGRYFRLRAADGSITVIDGYSFTIGVKLYFDQTKVIGLGDDITGDGTPNLIIEDWSGGAHCCETFHIFSLHPDGSIELISVIDARDGGGFDDIDGDGIYEFLMWDWSFAYKLTCFACLGYPDVILRYDGTKFAMAADLMIKPPPTNKKYQSLVTEIRAEGWSDKNIRGLDYLWSEMLQLIYTGNETLAWNLFNDVYPPDFPQKDENLKLFQETLEKSPFHKEIMAMQK